MSDSPITQVQKTDLNHSQASLITHPQSQNSLNNFPTKSVKGNKLKKKGIFNKLFCCLIPPSSGGNNNGADDGSKQLQQKSVYASNNTNNGGGNNDNRHELPQISTSGSAHEAPLLTSVLPQNVGKKTLVLDLDETLVHSSFKYVPNADFIVPVEIEGTVHQVYVVKRPYVDEFLKAIDDRFEIVIFTASLAKYADPVLDFLDKCQVVHYRLFREACHHHKGNYVKDLSRLGRDLKSTIIVDNSPNSYLFHPENAIPIDSWFDDKNDKELLDLLPLLDDLTKVDDVRLVLDESRGKNRW